MGLQGVAAHGQWMPTAASWLLSYSGGLLREQNEKEKPFSRWEGAEAVIEDAQCLACCFLCYPLAELGTWFVLAAYLRLLLI